MCVLPAWEPWAGPRAVSVPQGDPHALLRRLLAQHDGIEVPPVQGAFTAAFSRASDALACAVAGQQALVGCPVSGVGTPLAGALPDAHGHAQEVPLGPYLARMALDTGEVRLQAGTYHGSVLRHAVDMLLAAHAGQILCSEETVALLRRHCPQDVSLADLGLYRFNEKAAPERLFQAEYPEMPRREFPAPQAAVDGSGSLPLQFTRFFGREAELARLTGLLHPVGRPLLLTLTGPGGSGKTRLALEAARRLMEAGTRAQRGCGAIWYVALADLTDGRRIAEAVRDAMRLPRVSGVDPLAQVAAALSRRPSLLLLDNFEHLVTDGAPLLKSLRERVPTLACLVTSRRRLGLAGEREFPVPPLPMPNEGASPEGLARCESVQLFVDRAQAVRPDFQVTRANAAALAALCRRLEGIPLALELAAARAQVLTPAQMLSQMECRFDFLVSRQLRAAARHRTLRGAIDWSYQLLSPALQQFLARLSVFRGGWTLAAAEAVCEASPCGPSRSDGQPLALDYLEQLRECSLVQADEEGGEIRFRMLETLREYAREQLAPEEQAAGEDRHVQFYLALAERAEPELQGPDPGRWLERLEREHDNLRAALEWAVVHREAEVGLRLGGVLWEFWEMRGYFGEGRARLAELLALPPAAEFSAPGRAAALARAKALHGAGALACDQSDYSAARDLLEEALAIWRERGEKIGIAATLHHLADIALYQGHWEEARARYQESLAIHRELGERRGIARSLESLGTLLRKQSDFETARALYEESLKIRREHGNRLEIAVSLWNVGNLALDRGDYATARAFYQESRSVVSELGDRDGVGDALHNLGTVAYYEGDLAAARALFEECLTIRRELGNRRCLAMVLNSLGDVARKRREYEAARALFEESLAIRQALGDEEGIAGSLCSLGALAGCEGNSEVARARCEESLAIRRALGDGRGIIQCLEELAHGAGMSGDAARAARIYGAADAWREAIGLVRPPVDRDGYDQRVAAVRAVLGDDAFRSTWAVGREMTPEQVFADASDDARHD